MGRVLLEGSEFIGRGREADQVEGESAENRTCVRDARGLQSLFLKLGLDEAVDGMGGGAGGQGGLGKGLQRPPVERVGLLQGGGFRPDRAFGDPALQGVDLGGSEAVAFGRHARVVIRRRHEFDERAFGGFSRENVRGVAFAAVQSDLTVIEAEFALLLFRPVALHAVLLEDRFHLRLE